MIALQLLGVGPAIAAEEWNTIDQGIWWDDDNDFGSVAASHGRLVWTYPEGLAGGDKPGSRIIAEGLAHGPYQYHRDEGVLLSSGFLGHSSGVNKFRFWTQANNNTDGYVFFNGSGTGDLVMEINKVVPFSDNYRHAEGNSAAHLKSSLFGASETIVISEGRLLLGTWQAIFFCEFDGPRRRTVRVKIIEG